MSFPLNVAANPSALPYGGAPAAVNPVTVSLRVNIDVSGNVDVFAQTATTVNNVVDCTVTLPVAALYSSSSSAAFEFWEPSGNRGDISACIMGSASSARPLSGLYASSGAGSLSSVKGNLRSVILGGMDASNAAPFSNYKNVSANYTQYANFGELALGAHAAYLFGHPQATTAIDNDVALVTYFSEANPAGTTGSANANANANIGNELAALIRNLSDAEARTIVREVLRQDPARMTGADNSQLPTDVHQGLIFAVGDVVYVSVTIRTPSVTLGGATGAAQNNGAGAAAGALPSTGLNSFPSAGAQYTLRIHVA